MEIFIIILLFILIIINGIGLYLKFIPIEKKTVKLEENKPKLTKEEEEKQKRIKESFDNLMNYDEATARKRK